MTDVTNSLRAHWAELSLRRFIELTGCDRESGLGDLLCNLMHWSKHHEFDFELALTRGRGHFAAELAEEAGENDGLGLFPYSVLLLYPDYHNDGADTYFAHVLATDAESAVQKARSAAVAANTDDEGFTVIQDADDFAALLVLEGHHGEG